MSNITQIPVADGSDMNEAVRQYRELKQAVADVDAEAKKTKAVLNAAIAQLSGMFMNKLKAAKMETFRTEEGTVHKITKTSIKVNNWDETLTYIKDNNRYDLLNAQVGKKAIQDDMVANKGKLVVPGVEVVNVLEIGVRKK